MTIAEKEAFYKLLAILSSKKISVTQLLGVYQPTLQNGKVGNLA